MPSGFSSPSIIVVGRILLLALAYFVAGRLALLLAIPPGFATAIFPPLGISLAAVLLWNNGLLLGVLVGSTWLNIDISIMAGAPFNFSTIMIALEIALGSCIATWCGASLIRRFIGFPNSLTDEWSIFLFFILGGPIAAILSATIGVSTLCVNGIIPISNYTYSWLTWWTGDAIGVLIAAPFIFILFARPRILWRDRFNGVGVPLLVSCILIVVIFFRSSQTEQQKVQKSFDINAEQIGEKIYDTFDNHIRALTPLKGFFITSEKITAEKFRIFTTDLLHGTNAVSYLAWNQEVDKAERDSFERKMIDEGFSDFVITEKNSDGKLIPAKIYDKYVVVTYLEPFSKTSRAHGFDVASDPTRNSALLLANETGSAAMSAPLHLLQVDADKLSYLIYMPVYKTLEAPKTLAMRNQFLRGYATSSLTIETQIKKIQTEYPAQKYAIVFTDITDKNNPVNLYKDALENHSENSFYWESQKNIGGRELLLQIFPTMQFMADNRGLQSWYVLVGGLLFCSMLGGFLLLVSGRAQHIASLVEQRTMELESILNESVEAIIIVGENGIIERANPAACSLFMLLKNQLIGTEVITIIPSLANVLEHSIDSTANNNKSEIISNNCIWKSKEAIGICSDNSYIPIEIGVSRVELPGRDIYTCMIHDITARKKVDRLKSEFISTVSHELRTPLTSINGVLGLLAGGAVSKIPDKAIDLLVIAKNNADRLGRLVNDILDIEKLEFGQLQLDVVDCDAQDLIRQALVQNTGYAVKYGVNLLLEDKAFTEGEMIIKVDPDRFLQVMSNLISNAVKYSNLNEIVTISVEKGDGVLTVYVKDTGAGIPEAFRDRIFQKFAQADSSDTRKRDGTGLGLSITRVIVERMGGAIDYVTEINKGTTFYFSLPLVDKDKK